MTVNSLRPVLSPSKTRGNISRFDSCVSTDPESWKRSASSSFVTDVDQENIIAQKSKSSRLKTVSNISTLGRRILSRNLDPPMLSKSSPALEEVGGDGIHQMPPKVRAQPKTKTTKHPDKRPLEQESDITLTLTSSTNIPISSNSAAKRARLTPSTEDRTFTEDDSLLNPDIDLTSHVNSMHSLQPQDQSYTADENVVMSGDNTELAVDDSCLSTFSVIPNSDMSLYARLNRSPSRLIGSIRSRIAQDRKSLLSGPVQGKDRSSADSSSSRSPVKIITRPALLTHLSNERRPGGGSQVTPSTPGRNNLMNLLDFDLHPAPTPKSVPSISVRELETLKSDYLSRISSLKASLSGREAEVSSLKGAVTDAERRVGEAHETLREERAAREHAQRENTAWEQSHLDLKKALDGVKEEYLENEKERDHLQSRVAKLEKRTAEAEKRAETAEKQANEASSKMAIAPISVDESGAPLYTADQVQRQIDSKIQALSSELHSIYKKKHLTKVAGLKKGFEEKLKRTTSELHHEISVFKTQTVADQKKDNSSSTIEELSDLRKQCQSVQKRYEEQKVELEAQRAAVAGLSEEMKSVKISNSSLTNELENERVEKGELVAAVDEMLALQAEISSNGGSEISPRECTPPSSATSASMLSANPSEVTDSRPNASCTLSGSISDPKLGQTPKSARTPGRGNTVKPRTGHPVSRRV